MSEERKSLEEAITELKLAALTRAAHEGKFDLRFLPKALRERTIQAQFKEMLELQPIGVRMRHWVRGISKHLTDRQAHKEERRR